MKVSFSSDIILSGWLGSKHLLTNQSTIVEMPARFWLVDRINDSNQPTDNNKKQKQKNPNKRKTIVDLLREKCISQFLLRNISMSADPQWGAADAEIKVPSGENTELKRSPFKAWGRSVYSRTCYAYCQGFLVCLFLPFRSIHLHFFPKPLLIFPCVGCG